MYALYYQERKMKKNVECTLLSMSAHVSGSWEYRPGERCVPRGPNLQDQFSHGQGVKESPHHGVQETNGAALAPPTAPASSCWEDPTVLGEAVATGARERGAASLLAGPPHRRGPVTIDFVMSHTGWDGRTRSARRASPVTWWAGLMVEGPEKRGGVPAVARERRWRAR